MVLFCFFIENYIDLPKRNWQSIKYRLVKNGVLILYVAVHWKRQNYFYGNVYHQQMKYPKCTHWAVLPIFVQSIQIVHHRKNVAPHVVTHFWIYMMNWLNDRIVMLTPAKQIYSIYHSRMLTVATHQPHHAMKIHLKMTTIICCAN